MTKSSHIAVFAFPFSTHAAPLLTLVRRLAASVSSNVIFSFFSTSSSNADIFKNNQKSYANNIKAYDVWDGVPEGHILSSSYASHQEAIAFFLKACPHNFGKGVEEAEAETGVKVTCFLTDAFLWFSGEMAVEKGVPWVAFWTAGACSLSTHVYTDLIRTEFGASGQAETNIQRIPGMSSIHISDLPGGILSGNLQSPFSEMLHKMGLKLPAAAAVAINSFEELETTIINDLKSKLKIVLNIGPSTAQSTKSSSVDDQNGCLCWLDKQKFASVAYLSFGTVMTPPSNELVALSEALEARKDPFLWSLRDEAREKLPKGFVERTSSFGKIVSWAPQLQVLAHASLGVLVTHCGWNSLLESISNGVPMICRPFFGDQMLNARMVQDEWRIGVKVEGGVFTKGSTMNALEVVLSSDRGKEMKQNVEVLKGYAIQAVGSNGSSTHNFKALCDIITTSGCI